VIYVRGQKGGFGATAVPNQDQPKLCVQVLKAKHWIAVIVIQLVRSGFCDEETGIGFG
jgi:hypothetical protein